MQALPADARAHYIVVGRSRTKQNIIGRVELRADGHPRPAMVGPVVGRPARVAADIASGVVRELGLPTHARVVAGNESELAHDLQAQAEPAARSTAPT